MSSSTAPSIQRIPYSAPREDFIRAIERDGCVIIQDLTTPEVLAQAQKEVQPCLDANEEMSTVGGRHSSLRSPVWTDKLTRCSAEWRHEDMYEAHRAE